METITHSFISLALLFLISALAFVIVFTVFRKPARSGAPLRKLEFELDQLGGSFGYPQFILVSFLSLFLEMLMIRWISSEIRIQSSFRHKLIDMTLPGVSSLQDPPSFCEAPASLRTPRWTRTGVTEPRALADVCFPLKVLS